MNEQEAGAAYDATVAQAFIAFRRDSEAARSAREATLKEAWRVLQAALKEAEHE